MSVKDWLIIAGAAAVVVVMLRVAGGKGETQQDATTWATQQGNTGFPDLARTGGGVWV